MASDSRQEILLLLGLLDKQINLLWLDNETIIGMLNGIVLPANQAKLKNSNKSSEKNRRKNNQNLLQVKSIFIV